MSLRLISVSPLDRLVALLPRLEMVPCPLTGADRAFAEEALRDAVRTCDLLVAYGVGLAGKPSRN